MSFLKRHIDKQKSDNRSKVNLKLTRLKKEMNKHRGLKKLSLNFCLINNNISKCLDGRTWRINFQKKQ